MIGHSTAIRSGLPHGETVVQSNVFQHHLMLYRYWRVSCIMPLYAGGIFQAEVAFFLSFPPFLFALQMHYKFALLE